MYTPPSCASICLVSTMKSSCFGMQRTFPVRQAGACCTPDPANLVAGRSLTGVSPLLGNTLLLASGSAPIRARCSRFGGIGSWAIHHWSTLVRVPALVAQRMLSYFLKEGPPQRRHGVLRWHSDQSRTPLAALQRSKTCHHVASGIDAVSIMDIDAILVRSGPAAGAYKAILGNWRVIATLHCQL